MVTEYCTLEAIRGALRYPPGNTRDDDLLLEMKRYGNAVVHTALSAIADESQLAPGSPYFDLIAACALEHALSLFYERQGFGQRHRDSAARAAELLKSLVARLKADRPQSTRVVTAHASLQRGLTLFDGEGYATLGVG